MEPTDTIARDRLGRGLHELRISVTDRCNFRCGYCMPQDSFRDDAHFLPHAEILSFEEIARLARVFVSELGVHKLRLTGGEPLLRRQLPTLVRMLAVLPGLSDLALTTNGYLLAEHAQALRDAGLTRLTVSLDSLDAEGFARMSGCTPAQGEQRLMRVLEGIDAAIAAGFAQLKLNAVVIAGQNEASILALAERFRGTPHVVRFIEYMDVGTQNHWQVRDVVSAAEILRRIGARWPLEVVPPQHPGEVAQRYRYRDGRGEIGVIASVTQPFCGDCRRARLSADGQLLTCLFAASGRDLKRPLRAGASDAVLAATLREAWAARADRYSELRAEARTPQPPAAGRRGRRRLEMYQVGG
ncbi:MAG TPA: GTP 3',8-cyclase MoaA [Polyangiales bacterium]|nr:GTP 3',8-cyclase MoaA [Polyangiales bacterium]